MSEKQTVRVSSGGVGFTGLLQIVFIVLKLTGYIDWSWWWVLSPTWGSIFLFITVLAVIAIVAAILALVETYLDS